MRMLEDRAVKETKRSPQGFLPLPTSQRSNWDTLSIGAFLAAGTLGVATLCNNIRQKFYQSFVRPTYSDLIAEYDGGRVPDPQNEGQLVEIPGKFKETRDRFAELRARKDAMPIAEFQTAAKAYRTEMATHAKSMRDDISKVILAEHNIPTHGVRGWTEGIVKRWQNVGKHGRMDAALGFAALGAMSMGAVLTVRHNKHSLDRIEQRFETLDRERQQGRA